MSTKVRELAKISRVDLIIEDHGCLILDLTFNYEGGSAQGLPLIVQGEDGGRTIKGIMEAVGVTSWRELRNKSCWVTQDSNAIYKIEPLHKNGGKVWTRG